MAKRDNATENQISAKEAQNDFLKSVPLIKGVNPQDERYVFGVVLEPETVDSQGDIYSAEEIRKAAHLFMEEYGGLGLQHRFQINDQVRILESYVSPAEFSIGDSTIRKGTWLLAVRVNSDDIWAKVQKGEITGFSIGGSSRSFAETTTRSAQ